MSVATKLITNISLAVSFALSTYCMADANDDLFDMSLEQLLDVEVITVSKRSEPITEAPGVVTVISAAEIKAYGARNIKDILLRLPNFYMFDSATFTASGVTMRAGATQHLNNHVLYLIDGRPLRESQNGGLQTDINLLFPIDAIARIEVIRGPGSVLYGSNAFSGTINFITKSSVDTRSAKLKTQAGSDQYWANTAMLKLTLGESGNVSLFVNNLKDDGALIRAIDEKGVDGTSILYRDGKSAYMQLDYQGFSINGMSSDLSMPMLSGANFWSNKADLNLKRDYLDVGYDLDINDNWSTSFHYTYNRQERNIARPSGINSNYLANGYQYELTVLGKIGPNVNLVTGTVIDVVRGDLGLQGGAYRSKREGVYSQIDYQMQSSSKVSMGLQWNRAQGHSEVSPRFAFIHRFNKYWISKILYAEAFRSPYGSELFFEASFLQGNHSLIPEQIKTTEGQLIYTASDFSLTGTFYHNKTSETIGRAIVDGVTSFVNLAGNVNFNGLELESSWRINSQWAIQGNYSYQLNENESGMKDVIGASRMMAKVGFSYQSLNGIQVGLWNSYFGKVSKLENNPYYSINIVNPEAGAYNLLSVNVSMNLADVFEKTSLKGLELSIYADNILNQDVWFADLSRFKVNSYPQSHARGVFASLSYSF
ncbi:TonB-dependent receptor plug domain-containing protein [Paraglaciecola sp.]|uniref:TonB-dependent receptor plug domain-containing protein n=1 Tax=Paraglaciecola sp. TaxID=1920173 RepID=UPI003EF3F872